MPRSKRNFGSANALVAKSNLKAKEANAPLLISSPAGNPAPTIYAVTPRVARSSGSGVMVISDVEHNASDLGISKKKQHYQSGVSQSKVDLSAAKQAMVDYGSMILCPEEHPVVRAPSPFPARVAVSRWREVIELATISDASGNYWYEFVPGLDECIFTSIPLSTPWTQSSTATFAGSMFMSSSNGALLPLNGEAERNDVNGFGFKLGQAPTATNSASVAAYLPISNTGLASVMTIQMDYQPDDGYPVSGVVSFWQLVTGTWSVVSTIKLEDLTATAQTVSYPSNFTGMGMSFTTDEVTSGLLTFTITPSVAVNWVAATANYSVIECGLLNAVDFVTGYRVTGASAFQTYQGSELNNQGQVAGMLINANSFPTNFAPSGGGQLPINATNLYSCIAAQSYNRYDGPHREGLHASWLPGNVDDMTMKPLGNNKNPEYKIVAAGSWNSTAVGQSTRLMFTVVVEYTTLSPYIPTEVGPVSVNYSWLLHLLLTKVPLVTSNEKHIVAKLGSYLRTSVGRVYEYIREHPELLVQALKALPPLLV